MSELLSDNSAALNDLKDLVASQLADEILESEIRYGELTIVAKRDDILKVLTFLRMIPAACSSSLLMFVVPITRNVPSVLTSSITCCLSSITCAFV